MPKSVRSQLLWYCAQRGHCDEDVAELLTTISGGVVEAATAIRWLACGDTGSGQPVTLACKRAAVQYLSERGHNITGSDLLAPNVHRGAHAVDLESAQHTVTIGTGVCTGDRKRTRRQHYEVADKIYDPSLKTRNRQPDAHPLIYSRAAPALPARNEEGDTSPSDTMAAARSIIEAALARVDLAAALYGKVDDSGSTTSLHDGVATHRHAATRVPHMPRCELFTQRLNAPELPTDLVAGRENAHAALAGCPIAGWSISGGSTTAPNDAEFNARIALSVIDALADTDAVPGRGAVAASSVAAPSWFVPIYIDVQLSSDTSASDATAAAPVHIHEQFLWDVYRPRATPLQFAVALCAARGAPTTQAPTIANAIGAQLIAWSQSVTPTREAAVMNAMSQLRRAAVRAGDAIARGTPLPQLTFVLPDVIGALQRSAFAYVLDPTALLGGTKGTAGAEYVASSTAVTSPVDEPVLGEVQPACLPRRVISIVDLTYSTTSHLSSSDNDCRGGTAAYGPSLRLPHGFVAAVVPSHVRSESGGAPWIPPLHPTVLLAEWLRRTRMRTTDAHVFVRAATGGVADIDALVEALLLHPDDTDKAKTRETAIPSVATLTLDISATLTRLPTNGGSSVTTRRREASSSAARTTDSESEQLKDTRVAVDTVQLDLAAVLDEALASTAPPTTLSSGYTTINTLAANVARGASRGKDASSSIMATARIALHEALNAIIAAIARSDVDWLLRAQLGGRSSVVVGRVQPGESIDYGAHRTDDDDCELILLPQKPLQHSYGPRDSFGNAHRAAAILPSCLAHLVPGAISDALVFDGY